MRVEDAHHKKCINRQRFRAWRWVSPLRRDTLKFQHLPWLTSGVMLAARINFKERPRELRRRVVLPARLRAGAQWSDACILNISSRGLMIQSGRAGPAGSRVELRRGDHVIVARVVWREGARAGLASDERLPVEEIMSLGQSSALQLVASDGTFVERRKEARTKFADSRLRGRAFEFAGVGAIALVLALGIWGMAQQALSAPLAKVEAALGG